MTYSEFNFIKAIKEFGLIEQRLNLFEPIQPLEPSAWLREALDIGLLLKRAEHSLPLHYLVAPWRI